MKNIVEYLPFALLCAVLIAAFAFKNTNASRADVVTIEDENGNAFAEDQYGVQYDASDPDFWAPAAIYKTWTLDTITNTEKDTLALSSILESAYQYSIQARVLRISGTKNVKFVLDQTNATGSTVWMPIDSVSAASPDTLKTVFLMKGANVWGNKHRIRVVGTGTQSTSYQVTALYKRTN